MAIKLAVTPDAGEFHVWAMLDDSDFNQNPMERGESFVIASARTVPTALVLAKRERLVGVIEVLQVDDAARDAIVVPQTMGGR